MKIILKDITLLDPEKNNSSVTNMVITDGKISKIGDVTAADKKDAQVYDFTGKYCAPGFFDMHVHLREPGREDKETVETGCNGAAAGGFSGVASMPNTTPAADSAETVMFIKQKAANHLVDVYPVGAATAGRKGEAISPMAELKDAGAVAFSDDGTAIKTAKILRIAMEYSNMLGLPIIEHCEDESLAGGSMHEGSNSTLLGLPAIPSLAEDLIVMRDIMMAEYIGAHVHIAHISTKTAVEMVRQAKKKGLKVTAEVTPHHFSLTDESLKTYDTHYKMNPPLRTKEDVDAMIEGLKDGTIDCIASDHAPHTLEEKEAEFVDAPNGILGLETSLGLSFTELYHKKHLTLLELVEKYAVNPRKILNIPVPKLAAGEAANLTIFDPEVVWTADVKKFKSKSFNTPFDKKLLTGKSLAVINKGQMYYQDKFIAL
ncbi:MAG TPA: dihydroorotase [Ignavibacteriales bacterium]|nr:dihydroorotase [Ignavibacteriales bacterium]